jgi:tRNA-2-methylthio-N6-dimethylallyladenosine synthase
MEATDDVAGADVVVLNTCCIRENADDKLYGTLGHLKSLKAKRPAMQVVVAGCLAQKDRDLVQRRAPYVDVVLGTHNVGALVGVDHHPDRLRQRLRLLHRPFSPRPRD